MVAIERRPHPVAPAAAAADAIPPAARCRTASPRQVFAACAIGAAVLALFAAPDLPGWADRLPDGSATAALRDAANLWAAATARLGLERPHQELRREVGRALDLEWR